MEAVKEIKKLIKYRAMEKLVPCFKDKRFTF